MRYGRVRGLKRQKVKIGSFGSEKMSAFNGYVLKCKHNSLRIIYKVCNK